MNGFELSRAFYEEYGREMIEKEFPEYKDRIAVGLAGHGSECFGFDDDISKDHDFGPGFCLWLTEEDEREIGFRLFRAYKRLPSEFMGISTAKTSLMGGNFRGVQTINGFYSFYIGTNGIPSTNESWLAVPDYYLAEATNGCVFEDKLGEFTSVRKKLLENRPEDVRLKKLASAVFNMAQKGQYNYERCMNHGEKAAAFLMLSEFARSAAQCVFLLCNQYAPYDKWLYRGLRYLPEGDYYVWKLTEILENPFEKEKNLPLIEDISANIAENIRRQNLSVCTQDYLEPYAYDILNKIRDNGLRNGFVML